MSAVASQFRWWACMVLNHSPTNPDERVTDCRRCRRRIERLGGSWW